MGKEDRIRFNQNKSTLSTNQWSRYTTVTYTTTLSPVQVLRTADRNYITKSLNRDARI